MPGWKKLNAGTPREADDTQTTSKYRMTLTQPLGRSMPGDEQLFCAMSRKSENGTRNPLMTYKQQASIVFNDIDPAVGQIKQVTNSMA